MRSDLPSGTVTFLFTDIEGSTRLLHELGEADYEAALAYHRAKLRDAFARHGGVEVDTQGDAFFYAFADAREGVAAASEAQTVLADGPVNVRIGLHTGEARLTAEGYVGREVHRGARIAAAGHGGQVLLSKQTRELVDGELTDLGEHRLKDFADPVWIYQLGPERFPPLKTISNTNLPRPASSFIGREKEVADIRAMLGDGARMLTLTGPGGTGKTRLAIEAAAELVPEFRNGVFWVDLANVREPGLVLATIGQTIGADDDLAGHIGERQMLLVLDNLEQVVAAAPELAALVASCPNMRLLETSRELLRVSGEVDYPVRPLAEHEAAELFSARAGLAADDTVVELCRRLDNLPLAVELAAARSTVLSPAQILERIGKRLDLLKGGRDTEARQQTLRATIEWSHDLLDAAERTLFARLSVFAGGFTVESADAVCDAELDVLQSLIEKSLLVHSVDRFSMLETIREFAAERLEHLGDADATRQRHAEYFLAIAHEAEPHVLGTHPMPWLNRLEEDHTNIRAALDYFEALGDTQRALELAGTIWEFWCLRSHYAEGWQRLEHLLEIDERPTMPRAKALTGAGHLAPHLTEAAATELARTHEALALHRALGDPWGIAFAEFEVAGAYAQHGDFVTALPVAGESVRRFRALRDEHRALQALRVMAWCTLELGQIEPAKALYGELLDAARAAGDTVMEARALASIAWFASKEGNHRRAAALLSDAFRLDQEFGDPGEIADDLIRFARALALARKAEAAVQLVSLADAKQEELHSNFPGYILADREEALSAARSLLNESQFTVAWEQGSGLTVDEGVALAVRALDSDGG
jgi:predicted ATPase